MAAADGEQPGESENPSDKPGQKPGEKPGKDGRPQGGHEVKEADPSNQHGDTPPLSGKEVVAVRANAERWGTLPDHAKAVFSSQGSDGLPPRYRDWIDSYHRRLNKEN